MPPPPIPTIPTALWRGARRRCPRCGRGGQFRRWFTLHARCEACGLEFEPRPGDTWLFWILGDRIFIAVVIVLLYLGVAPRSAAATALFLGLVIGAIVGTMEHRQGLCTAIDYLVRRHGDPTTDPPASPPLPPPSTASKRTHH